MRNQNKTENKREIKYRNNCNKQYSEKKYI